MSKLIKKLTEFQYLSPDEIVKKLSNGGWTKGSEMTPEFHNENRYRMVYLYQFDSYGTGTHFNSYPSEYEIGHWGLSSWQTDAPYDMGSYWFILVEECNGQPDPPVG